MNETTVDPAAAPAELVTQPAPRQSAVPTRPSTTNATTKATATATATAAGVLRPMPPLGPEVLRHLFRFGPLGVEQLAGLLLERRSPRWVRHTVGVLAGPGDRDTPGVGTRAPHQAPYQPSNQTSGAPEAAGGARKKAARTSHRDPFVICEKRQLPSSGGRRSGLVVYLTEAGLAFTAAEQDLNYDRAKKEYGQVVQETTVGHALLRNEFYGRLMGAVREARAAGKPLSVETLTAESGVDPIRLSPGKGGAKRYLNPDGLIEAFAGPAAGRRFRILVEADTGSQYHRWQISAKANRYAEYFSILQNLRETSGDPEAAGAHGNAREEPEDYRSSDGPYLGPTSNTGVSGGDLPRVLFVSADPKRSYWVREVFIQTARDPQSPLHAIRERLQARGIEVADLLRLTNLAWIEEGGPLGAACISVKSSVPTEIFS